MRHAHGALNMVLRGPFYASYLFIIIERLQAASCLDDLDVFVALAVGPVVLAPVGVVTIGQRAVTMRCTHAEPSPYPRLRWQLAQLFLHQ